MEFSAYFEAVVPGEQNNEERWTISVNTSTCADDRTMKREERTNKGTFLINAVEEHVCTRNRVWCINKSNVFCPYSTNVWTVYVHNRVDGAGVTKTRTNNTFFNIETSHFWRCSTRNTETERANYRFSWRGVSMAAFVRALWKQRR